jgi:hypothetical protein
MSVEDLPLAIQKSIRDNEKVRDEELKKLSDTIGEPVTFEVDWVTLHEQYTVPKPQKNKDKFPELVYTGYLQKLTPKIIEFLKHPLTKKAYLDTVTTRKIGFKFGDVEKDCSSVRVQDGILWIIVPSGKFMTNNAFVGNDLIFGFDVDQNILPLNVRKDIFDFEKTRNDLLEKLKTATGQDWTFDIDYSKLYNTDGIPDRPKKKFIECLVNDYLGNFVPKVIEFLKDDLNKKAFDKQVTTPKISFEFGPVTDKNNIYHQTSIRDGGLIITVPPLKFMTNNASVGVDLKKLF